MADPKKRRRPSAKETRARMARAAASETPATRTPEPDEDREAGAAGAGQGPAAAPASGEEAATRRGQGGRGDGGAAAGGERSGRLVRLSVDVPRETHRRLRVMAAEEGTTGMALVRALIAEMEEDEGLAERVRERLAGA